MGNAKSYEIIWNDNKKKTNNVQHEPTLIIWHIIQKVALIYIMQNNTKYYKFILSFYKWDGATLNNEEKWYWILASHIKHYR